MSAIISNVPTKINVLHNNEEARLGPVEEGASSEVINSGLDCSAGCFVRQDLLVSAGS